MADNRIAGLSAITQIDTSLDFLPIVDVSDNQMAGSGTTKKITINQILGAGGSVVVPLGTAAAPAISFSGDPNTGIFSTQADQLAITVGGTTRGTFSSTGLSVTGNLSASGSITTSIGSVSGIQLISTAPNGTQPLAITSQTVVSNLNSDYLDGQHGNYYQNADNINAGTLSVARGGTGAATFTAGRVLFGNGTSALNTSANLFWDNSNNRLGIGTATPAASLQVGTRSSSAVANNSTIFTAGGASASAGTTVAATFANTVAAAVGNEAQITFTPAGNYSATGAIGTEITSTTNGESALKFYTYHSAVAGLAEKFRIASDGVCTWSNVGGVAGTAMTLDGTGLGVGVSPLYKLDVSSASNQVVRITSSSNLNTGLNLVNTTASTWSIYSFGSNDASLANSFGIYHQSGTLGLQITSSGNVGIGTATPSVKVQVDNNGQSEVRIRNTSGSGIAALALVAGAQQSNPWYIYADSSRNLIFQDGGSDRGRIDSSGNLGLGVTPSSWDATFRSISVGINSAAAFMASEGATTYIGDEGYYNAGWKHSYAGVAATLYKLSSGIHDWYSADSGATAGSAISYTLRMRLTKDGNLGLGVTPNTWAAVFMAIQFPDGYAAIAGDNGNGVAELLSNAYNDGAWKFRNAQGAVRYRLDAINKTHIWYNSTNATPTANGAITWNPAMVLDASGNLGLGIATPAKLLDVRGATASGQYVSTTGTNVTFHAFTNTGGGVLVGKEGSAGSALFLGTAAYSAVFGTDSAYPICFATNNNTRMTLDASGNLLVGTVTAVEKLTLAGNAVLDDGSNGRLSLLLASTQNRIVSTTIGFGDYKQLEVNGENIRFFTGSLSAAPYANAERFRIKATGQVNFVGQASDPAGAAGDVYYNSASNKLKFYDSAWKTIPASDQVSVANGTAAAPSISFDSDTNTGIYRSGADTLQITTGGVAAVRFNPNGSFGYTVSVGGAVEQDTSRTTGVTLNKACGAITLVSAAGSTSWQTFTVTNNTVDATDVIRVCQKSGTDLYQIHVTNVANGSFKISFATTGGTTTEQPVFNFAVIKAGTGDPI